MRVRCIDDRSSCFVYTSELKVGNEYDVLGSKSGMYLLRNEIGYNKWYFKYRFEAIEEDKMEEIKIVRKLEDLDGLENGMGATAVYDEVNKRVRIRTKEECLGIGIAYSDEYSDLDGFLTVMKVIGFKFEYKPSRSLEEVVEEARTKIVEFVHGKSNYLLVKALEGYVVDRDVYLERVGSLYLCKEQAQKYADELNEILKGGK